MPLAQPLAYLDPGVVCVQGGAGRNTTHKIFNFTLWSHLLAVAAAATLTPRSCRRRRQRRRQRRWRRRLEHKQNINNGHLIPGQWSPVPPIMGT